MSGSSACSQLTGSTSTVPGSRMASDSSIWRRSLASPAQAWSRNDPRWAGGFSTTANRIDCALVWSNAIKASGNWSVTRCQIAGLLGFDQRTMTSRGNGGSMSRLIFTVWRNDLSQTWEQRCPVRNAAAERYPKNDCDSWSWAHCTGSGGVFKEENWLIGGRQALRSLYDLRFTFHEPRSIIQSPYSNFPAVS